MTRESHRPECFQARFLLDDGFLNSSRSLLPKSEFGCHGGHEFRNIDALAGDEMPEVIKITGLVAGAIRQSQNFLGRGFGKRVRLDDSAIRQIREFLVSAEDRADLQRNPSCSRIVMSTLTLPPAGNGPTYRRQNVWLFA